MLPFANIHGKHKIGWLLSLHSKIDPWILMIVCQSRVLRVLVHYGVPGCLQLDVGFAGPTGHDLDSAGHLNRIEELSVNLSGNGSGFR